MRASCPAELPAGAVPLALPRGARDEKNTRGYRGCPAVGTPAAEPESCAGSEALDPPLGPDPNPLACAVPCACSSEAGGCGAPWGWRRSQLRRSRGVAGGRGTCEHQTSMGPITC